MEIHTELQKEFYRVKFKKNKLINWLNIILNISIIL